MSTISKGIMKHITFVTGNSRKFEEALLILRQYGVMVEQLQLNINEIQHHDPLEITKAKARAAYQKAGRPVVVNDTSWDIPALNGFPGGYMKDVCQWFSTEDFLALMRNKSDKTIIANDVVAYYDGKNLQVFTSRQPGYFIDQPRGKDEYSHHSVIVMSGNDERTIAEVFDARANGEAVKADNYEHWQQFGEWFALQP